MGHPLKYFPHGSVIFATMSLEVGLLLQANPLCEFIIKSTLARAAALYKVKVCGYLVEPNHIHMLLVVIGPDDTKNFIGYLKAEVAHRLNIIMGFRKRTVWCEGYDSPVVLTPTRALIALAYLYANPAKDNLEDSIEKYPGLSSWKMFRSGNHCKHWQVSPRRAYRELGAAEHSLAGYTREAARIARENQERMEFSIEPDAWLEAFGITNESEKAAWNETLVKRVRTLEERARRKRLRKKSHVIGAEGLRRRCLTLNYKSKRSGRRMWCLADSRATRQWFIDKMRDLIQAAHEVFLRWHVGDYSVPYPPGLFPPLKPKLMEPLGLN